jgi:hypothetical protein
LTGLGHFLADILAPFFKENYPALENILLLMNFSGWLLSLLQRVFYYHLPKFEK